MISNKLFLNKYTFITGATSQIGSELCLAFSDLGSNLILTDNNIDKLKSLKKQLIKKNNKKVLIFKCDLSSLKSRNRLIDNIKKKVSSVDFIINNAAFTGSYNKKKIWNGSIDDQSIFLWKEVLEINLISIFHLVKEIYKKQKKNNYSSIINIGSIYSEIGPDLNLYKNLKIGSPAAYFASKGGLLQLTKWLAANLAPIRVNMISPGGILNNQPKKFVKRYVEKLFIKRMCKVDDVVNLAVFLCSKKSNYITGQNIKVDGGFTCS